MIHYCKENFDRWGGLGPQRIVGWAANEIAETNQDFVLLYADAGKRIGIERLLEKHADRCYEVGIAEQNEICMAAGMASEGLDVFAVAYAPFITARVLDQVRVNLGYMKAPVKLVGIGAGLGPGDLGATHTALEDIGNMREIPNMVVVSPADCTEAVKTIEALSGYESPAYVRMTAAQGIQKVYEEDYDFQIGRAVELMEGDDIALMSCGTVTYQAKLAVEQLRKRGVSCSLTNMHTIKPLDQNAIDRKQNSKYIVTIEEHNIIGGLGGAVAEYLSSKRSHPPLVRLGVNDEYFYADRGAALLSKAGLSAEGIIRSIMELAERK